MAHILFVDRHSARTDFVETVFLKDHVVDCYETVPDLDAPLRYDAAIIEPYRMIIEPHMMDHCNNFFASLKNASIPVIISSVVAKKNLYHYFGLQEGSDYVAYCGKPYCSGLMLRPTLDRILDEKT